MELSNSKIKKILIFREMQLLALRLKFSQKSFFCILGNRTFLKKLQLVTFRAQKNFLYSEKLNFLDIKLKNVFLYFRKELAKPKEQTIKQNSALKKFSIFLRKMFSSHFVIAAD